MTDDEISRAEYDRVVQRTEAAKARASELEAELAKARADPRLSINDDLWAEFQRDQADAPQRQKLRELQAEESRLTGQLRSALADEALRAAAKGLAHNPSQVAKLLADHVELREKEDGTLVPMFRDEDGEPVDSAEGLVERFLLQANNANLVTPEGARRLGHVKHIEERVEATLRDLPDDVHELARMPAEIRDAVVDRLTSEQLEELANPDREAQGFIGDPNG